MSSSGTADLARVEEELLARWPETRLQPSLARISALVGLAYALFAEAPVDVAVIEVGMGGTWDATNVVDARIAVVTPVALDHAEYLGPDVPTIAGEKAGIIKRDAVAILARQEPGALDVLVRRAVEMEATVAREG